MEMIIFNIISGMLVGLSTNYIWDKLKNHSSTRNRKSGFELNIIIKFIKKK